MFLCYLRSMQLHLAFCCLHRENKLALEMNKCHNLNLMTKSKNIHQDLEGQHRLENN